MSVSIRWATTVWLVAATSQAADPRLDVANLISLAEVQQSVKGADLVGKPAASGDTTKYVYSDKQWPAIPIVTIQVKAPKDAAAELSSMVGSAQSIFGLKLQSVQGVGDECHYDDQFGTYYFRKGRHVATVGGKGAPGKIDVGLIDIARLLASRL